MRTLPLALVIASWAAAVAPVASGQAIDENQAFGQFAELMQARRYHDVERLARGVIARNPTAYYGYHWLGESLVRLGSYDEGVAQLERAVELHSAIPADRRVANHEYYLYRARFSGLLRIGEVAAALADVERMDTLQPENGDVWSSRAHVLLKLGRFDAALVANDKAMELNARTNARPGVVIDTLWDRSEIQRLLGNSAEALRSAQALLAHSSLGHCVAARVFGFPADLRTQDLAKAMAALQRIGAEDAATYPEVDRTFAMLLRAAGENARAWGYFENDRPYWRTRVAFEDEAHARCAIALGHRDRAIDRLVMACRRDPRFREQLGEAAWAPITDAVRAQLRDLDGGASVTDRLDIERRTDVSRLTLEQIRGFVRAFRLEEAVPELTALVARTSGVAHDEAELLARKVSQYAALKKLLVAAVNPKGKLHLTPLALPTLADMDPRIAGADLDGYQLKLKRGTAKGRWSQLSFAARYALLEPLATSGEQAVSLAELAWDTDEPALAERALKVAWRTATLRPKVEALLVHHRGCAPPPGGFDLHDGRFVTATEKASLAKGLVLFRGEWVTPEDRQHLERNHEKIGGAWVPATAEQLKARGFVEYEGEWYTADELARRRGEWDHAWELTTAHYVIRTNHSERFAKTLSIAIEDAYQAFGKVLGPPPSSGKPMRLLAFRTYEDYRAYCERTNNLAALNAAGFAPSEPGTACGYDKLKDEATLLETMVHEAAHLYFVQAYPAARPPSWLAEGMATYFEGFDVDAHAHLTFHHRPKSRAAGFAQALADRRALKLDEMLASNAGVLINTSADKALVFYAQSWALFYFLQQADPATKARFDELLVAVGRGSTPSLPKTLGLEPAALESAFLAYSRSR